MGALFRALLVEGHVVANIPSRPEICSDSRLASMEVTLGGSGEGDLERHYVRFVRVVVTLQLTRGQLEEGW